MNDARYLIHNDILSQISKALKSECLKIVFRVNVNPPVRIVHTNYGFLEKNLHVIKRKKSNTILIENLGSLFLYHTL